MATFIKVSNAESELLRRNRDQVQANRLQKVEADEQAVTGQQLQATAAAQQEQETPSGRRRQPARRDEPAASRALIGNKIGHFWWIVDNENINNTGYFSTGIVSGGYTINNYQATIRVGIKRTTRLFCGNGSKSIQIVHGQQPQQLLPSSSSESAVYPAYLQLENGNDDFAAALVLPSGNGSFILIFLASNSLTVISAPKDGATIEGRESVPGLGYFDQAELMTFTKTTQTNVTRRCFVCSNTDIRELSIPSSFNALLDLIHSPAPTEVPTKVNVLAFLNGTPVYIQTTIPTFSHFVPASSLGSTIAATPDVFYQATQVLPGGSNTAQAAVWSSLLGSAVKPLPSSLRWAIEDTATGAYQPSIWHNQTRRQLFNSNERFNYGSWRTPGQEPTAIDGSYDPTLYTNDPSATLSLATGRPVLSPAPVVTQPNLEDGLYAVWDWGDPAYCRTMCKALGFTDSDLQP